MNISTRKKNVLHGMVTINARKRNTQYNKDTPALLLHSAGKKKEKKKKKQHYPSIRSVFLKY